MLKIKEEVLCKLVILLSTQYEEVMKMLYNKEEITILNIPKVQGTPLLNLITKLSALEKDIPNINCINDLVEKVGERMKVMISQPMAGKSNEQIRLERENLVKLLKIKGMGIVDTIVSGDAPKYIDEAIYYLAKSIEYIGKVDCVFFMRGWEKARGCRIEHQVAIEYGKQTIYEN